MATKSAVTAARVNGFDWLLLNDVLMVLNIRRPNDRIVVDGLFYKSGNGKQ
jgi:hypothetical protein